MMSTAQTMRTVFASSGAWRYAASSLALMTFCVKRMVPLRIGAICRNVAFFCYGVRMHPMPVVLLHALLMPVNVVRLLQTAKTKIAPRPNRAWPADRVARVWSQTRGP